MVKAPEVGLAPRRWSVLELSLSHMYYVHFQFLTLKSVQEFYMHTFGYKDVKAPSDWHQRGHFLCIESLLVSDGTADAVSIAHYWSWECCGQDLSIFSLSAFWS